MATQIFVNLPVKNLQASVDFFTKLDYRFNPQFTNEKATCMIVADNISVMLLTEPFFKTFIKTEISDTAKFTESIICLSAENRQAVDELVDKAVAAGGNLYRESEDHGFMYSRAFSDPDGHLWEIMYMDIAAFADAQAKGAPNVTS